MKIRTDIFIVGTAKAGTSALYEYLSTRREVCVCSVKEPNFFSHEEIAAQGLYYKKRNVQTEKEYHKLFHPTDSTRFFGEASVSYLYYPGVARRIYAYNPNAKILICLRDPVRRAYSHYCMDFALGLVREPMETIWKNGPDHKITGNHYQQYFLVSDYTLQVKRYLDVFPANQIQIILHEDLCSHPKQTLEKIGSFIGLDPIDFENSLPLENVSGIANSGLIRWMYRHQGLRKSIRWILSEQLREQLKTMLFSKRGLPELPKALKDELTLHYESMKKSLHELTGLDLECWHNGPTAEYPEPTF